MNHFRLLATGTTLMFALISPAQQAAAGSAGTDKQEHGQRCMPDGVPTVEQHLKVLTEKLDLTGESAGENPARTA